MSPSGTSGHFQSQHVKSFQRNEHKLLPKKARKTRGNSWVTKIHYGGSPLVWHMTHHLTELLQRPATSHPFPSNQSHSFFCRTRSILRGENAPPHTFHFKVLESTRFGMVDQPILNNSKGTLRKTAQGLKTTTSQSFSCIRLWQASTGETRPNEGKTSSSSGIKAALWFIASYMRGYPF